MVSEQVGAADNHFLRKMLTEYRRAKIKNMAKKSYETGEDVDMPDSMRKYLAMQAMESGNIMSVPEYYAVNGISGYAPGMLINPDTSPKVSKYMRN